ncbi:MAG: SocA family protein [Clostridium sp.]|nr:SocA family protein [Clostridium sp.]
MEIEHGLIIHGDKSNARRIAYHLIIRESSDYSYLLEKQKVLKKKFPKVFSFSIHFIETDSDSLESIAEQDPFFERIKYIDKFEEFIKLIEKDFKFKTDDLIKLSLTKNSYSKLHLSNVMFFIEQNFLKTYKTSLIKEDFYAYKHGPVLKSVLKKFDSLNKEKIESISDEMRISLITRLNEMGLKDKLLPIVNEITEKCSEMSDVEIYNLGHKENQPWDIIYNDPKSKNDVIPKNLMMK